MHERIRQTYSIRRGDKFVVIFASEIGDKIAQSAILFNDNE